MAFSADDVASGSFQISGHWGIISGTAADVKKVLDVLKVTQEQVVSVVWDDTNSEFLILVHR